MKFAMIFAVLTGFATAAYAENTHYTASYWQAVRTCGVTNVKKLETAQGRKYYCGYKAPKQRRRAAPLMMGE